MEDLLNRGKIAMHPLVVGEIALGSLRNRRQKLDAMDSLRKVKVAQMTEVRRMIEKHMLYAKGIGLTDAHIIASCLLTLGTQLWTQDTAMKAIATSLGVPVYVPNPAQRMQK
jgi:predicted nucleic acid-binding protein